MSKRRSLTLDYIQQECKTAAGWAGSMVQVVQPWRELDFSALDDDLPLTTLLTCVSTGQLADRWQGGLSQVDPTPPPTPAWSACLRHKHAPRPRSETDLSSFIRWCWPLLSSHTPGGPSVPSHLQIRLWFIKVSQPTTPKITIPTSRPEQQQEKHPVCSPVVSPCLPLGQSLCIYNSPCLHSFIISISPAPSVLFAHRPLSRDPVPKIQTSRERATRHPNTHILTHTGSMASIAGNIVPPLPPLLLQSHATKPSPSPVPRLVFVVPVADCVDTQKRIRASQLPGGRAKDQQHRRAAPPPSQTMSTQAAKTRTTSSLSSGSRSSSNNNSSNNRTASSGRSPLRRGLPLPSMSSLPAPSRSSPPATTR